MSQIFEPVFILIRPQMGENIGAAARAMLNFGLRRMRLVGPRDGWPNPKAIAMASGAGALLDDAMVFEDAPASVADLTRVYATTARPRDMIKPVLTPEQAAADMAERAARGEKVGVLFGPERSGLENEDVLLAQTIITVDTNPAFPSLNLAQSALLLGYELSKAAPRYATPVRDAGAEPATGDEIARLLDHLIAALDGAGYFWPEHKRPVMSTNLRNIFHRAPLTGPEVRTLHGVVRALEQGPRRGAARAAPCAAAECADMDQLREGIDAIDRALIARFAERRAHIERAVELKRENGLPARIPVRVEEVVSRVRASAEREGLEPDLFESIWRMLIEAAIALEQERL